MPGTNVKAFTQMPEPIKNQIMILDNFKSFSNIKSNVYFWQEYICNQDDEICGGLRGIVCRSMFKRRLYDHMKITNIPDTCLLFNMTEHNMINIYEQSQTFLEMLEDIQERVVGFKTDVSIPFDNQSMNEILLEREFGIFGNLPH